MTSPTPIPDPAHPDHTTYYRRVLHELIDMGLDLARLTHAAAAQPAPPDAAATPAAPDLAASFERLARTIRRTVALAGRLDHPAPAASASRAARRRQVIRAVEDAIHRHARTPDAADALHAELAERLDGPDLDEDDAANRPVAAIIADICRDLGLLTPAGASPWRRRTPADIAALHARAAATGAPRAAPDRRAATSPPIAPERVFRLAAAPNPR